MAERPVFWAAAAQRDLEAIVDYIADREPANALKVFERLQARAMTLHAQNLRGRHVPELRDLGVNAYRELIELSWRIIYRNADDRIYVVAILDARRDLQAVLLDRLLRSP
jgi:plasmid stabilization system protein ParE